jgi:V/A-type H+-transporting ATPase subunit F
MAEKDTVTGFRLGGIKEGYPVKNMEEAGKVLEDLVKRNFSVIITTEKIGIEFKDTINKLTNERALPMVIEIPDKSGSIKRESDPMNELIKRVIGVEMVK